MARRYIYGLFGKGMSGNTCLPSFPCLTRKGEPVRGLNGLVVLVAAFAFLCLVAENAHAQAVSGSITGFVTDQSGATIPNANISVTNTNTGVVTKLSTDAAGLYNATRIPPGTYSVAVEAPGFKRAVQENITVQVDATQRIDIKLELGEITQQVTVTATAPLLESQKTDVATTISERQIEAIPVRGRNVTLLYDLVPGVVSGQGGNLDVTENPSGFEGAMVHGMWQDNNTYELDGIDDTAYGFSGFMVINPNPDFIQELKITTADYDPEFGQSAGLVAQYVTKSGTNAFHGTANWTNRNSDTFAADPITEKIAGTGPQGKGIGVPYYNFNTGDVAAGGPIKKDKMFVFGDYQLQRTIEGGATIASVPTPDERLGNFSAVGSGDPIYDPTTGNSDGTGRTQFDYNGVLNYVPPAQVSPVFTNTMKLIPLPNNGTGINNNYAGSGSEVFDTYNIDGRFDYNISNKDKIFYRYSVFHSDLNVPPLFGLAGGPSVTGTLAGEKCKTLSQNTVFDYTRTISPTLLTEFRFGAERFRLDGYQSDSGVESDNNVGILGINDGTPIDDGLATIVVGGPSTSFFLGSSEGTGIPRIDRTNAFQYVNNWTKTMGTHELRWGADVRRNRFDFESVNASSRGDFHFEQVSTASATVANSGLGLASFAAGYPNYYARAIYYGKTGERQTRVGIHFLDSWKVTPKLTLNLGLRWDYYGPDTPRATGGLANFDYSTGMLLLAGLGNVSRTDDIYTSKANFAPRLGLAYRVTEKTVIRAGLGRSYFGSNYGGVFYTLTSQYPEAAQETINSNLQYGPVFVLDGVTPVPTPPAPEFPSTGQLAPPSGQLMKGRPFNWKTEYVTSWNFTVERQFGKDMMGSVAYVGNEGTHIWSAPDLNAAVPGPGPLDPRRPLYNSLGINDEVSWNCNCVSSNYHGLESKFEKRFSKSYSLDSSFTWAKSLDEEFGGFAYHGQPVNPYDMKSSYGPNSEASREFVWTLSHNIRLPYGKGQHYGANARGIKEAVLGNWQFTGTVIKESGLYFSPGIGDTSTINSDIGQRPDRIPGIPLYSGTDNAGGTVTHDRSVWFNSGAFERPVFNGGVGPQCCRFGDAANGSLVGPPLQSADWSLSKEFKFRTPINEETTLQFRWENYNIFNWTNLGLPNSTIDSGTAGAITPHSCGECNSLLS